MSTGLRNTIVDFVVCLLVTVCATSIAYDVGQRRGKLEGQLACDGDVEYFQDLWLSCAVDKHLLQTALTECNNPATVP